MKRDPVKEEVDKMDSPTSARFDWRSSRKFYHLPTSYYSKFLETQKRYFSPLSKFHKRANYLFLTPSQKLCLQKIKELIHRSRTEPVVINLSGFPGTGKTFMLSVISNEIVTAGMKYCVASFTGKMACDLDGITLYRLLGLYDVHKPYKLQVDEIPPKETVKLLKSVNFILADEMSLVGAYFLNMMNHRLQRLRKCNKPFGGLNIVFSADLAQLGCIKDFPLTRDPDTVDDLFAKEGLLLYQNPTAHIVLTEQVRQKSDVRFTNLLTNLRNNNLTKSDVELLVSRHEYYVSDNDRSKFMGAPVLFATNRQINIYNEQKILEKNVPVKKIVPEWGIKCNECAKLIKSVFVGRGINLHVVKNIAYNLGIANGTSCTCVDVVFDGTSKLPSFIIVAVEKFKGTPLTGTRNHVPIPIITERVFCPHLRQRIVVKFLPVVNCEGISFYKAQGDTLPKVIVCLDGIRKNSKEFYVGCSRVEKLEDLLLKSSFPIEQFFV